jgi:hypothetical protein
VLEEGEVREDSKVALTEVDKDNNLEDGIGIEMDKLNLIVMKEDTEKITGKEAKSSLEKGSQHHDFLGMRGGNFFIFCRPPLNHDTVREEMLLYKFKQFLFIDEGGLELLGVRGSHGMEEET